MITRLLPAHWLETSWAGCLRFFQISCCPIMLGYLTQIKKIPDMDIDDVRFCVL
jgi:hypothetical protein